MVSIYLFSRMIFSKKSATFWDHAQPRNHNTTMMGIKADLNFISTGGPAAARLAFLTQREATIDIQRSGGHKGCRGRTEENDRVRDVVGAAYNHAPLVFHRQDSFMQKKPFTLTAKIASKSAPV